MRPNPVMRHFAPFIVPGYSRIAMPTRALCRWNRVADGKLFAAVVVFGLNLTPQGRRSGQTLKHAAAHRFVHKKTRKIVI